MTLKTYLESLPGITDVSPLQLVIGSTTYQGASYVREGRTSIYVLGKRPDTQRIARRAESKCCFTLEGDERDWYVACHSTDVSLKAHPEHHPFGHLFILNPWDTRLLNTKIDTYERKPYTRIVVHVRREQAAHVTVEKAPPIVLPENPLQEPSTLDVKLMGEVAAQRAAAVAPSRIPTEDEVMDDVNRCETDA